MHHVHLHAKFYVAFKVRGHHPTSISQNYRNFRPAIRFNYATKIKRIQYSDTTFSFKEFVLENVWLQQMNSENMTFADGHSWLKLPMGTLTIIKPIWRKASVLVPIRNFSLRFLNEIFELVLKRYFCVIPESGKNRLRTFTLWQNLWKMKHYCLYICVTDKSK